MALSRGHTYDTLLELEDGAAAITATEVNSGGEIDLGEANVHGMVVVHVSAIDTDASDRYQIELQGTSVSGFGTAASNRILGTLDLGDTASTGATAADTGADSVVGTYQFGFNNDVAGFLCRYVRLKVTTSGTGETITYKAHLAISKH